MLLTDAETKSKEPSLLKSPVATLVACLASVVTTSGLLNAPLPSVLLYQAILL